MVRKKAVIVGAGSHARAIIGILNQTDDYEILEILDLDFIKGSNENILGIPIKPIENLNLFKEDSQICIFLAIGDNNLRESLFTKLSNDFVLPNLISPFALIDKSVMLGTANVICSNVYIGPLVKIGHNNIINSSSVIEHEVQISNNCHTAPSSTICGRSSLGKNCFLGANATIIDKINICNGTTIGAGSTVINPVVDENLTLVGSPAKIISSK